MMAGRVFAVVGPSGAGKDSLMAAVLAAQPELHLVRRVITRRADAGGEDFEPATAKEFDRRQAQGEFVLHWQAHGLKYGIPASELTAAQRGRDVMFNASRAVLEEAAQKIPDLTVLHVTADAAVLAKRLAGRGRETPEDIEQRLARAAMPLKTTLPLVEIDNSGPLENAVAAVLALLSPVKA